MALLTKSSAARTALIYVTIGALTMVWTAVWAVYLFNYPPTSKVPYYWCGGFMVTGLTLLALGLGLGRIGRTARTAELPPPEVTAAIARADQAAAAQAPLVSPVPSAVHLANSVNPASPANSNPPRMATRRCGSVTPCSSIASAR